MVALGLNRWDWRSAEQFAASARAAEEAGLQWALLPVNPLAVPDPYVLMAAGLEATTTMGFGTLVETPVLRPPAVAAGSLATIARGNEHRVLFTYGIGDTAVRWLGLAPARIVELEAATRDLRALVSGEGVDVGADRPAFVRGAVRVPVWVAASGPRSLRAAGRAADGVFMRVGVHPENVREAVRQVGDGALEAGRSPDDVAIGLIVHCCRSQDAHEIEMVSRAMAAGFYEYAPALFTPPGFEWNGPPIEELRARVWPDFHHAPDLVAAGEAVSFLSEEVAANFSLFGTTADVAATLRRVLDEVPQVSIVVPHPVPMPDPDEQRAYASWAGEQLAPLLAP